MNNKSLKIFSPSFFDDKEIEEKNFNNKLLSELNKEIKSRRGNILFFFQECVEMSKSNDDIDRCLLDLDRDLGFFQNEFSKKFNEVFFEVD